MNHVLPKKNIYLSYGHDSKCCKTLRARHIHDVFKKIVNILVGLLATQFVYWKDFEQQLSNKPKQPTYN